MQITDPKHGGVTVTRTLGRSFGTIALVLGVVLLAVGGLLWKQASDDQEEARIAAGYERAILFDAGRVDDAALVDINPEAERTAPLVVLVLGASAIAAGAYVTATRRRAP